MASRWRSWGMMAYRSLPYDNIGLYIRKSGEIWPRVLWGLDPKRGALSRSATHTGACWTYFPQPQTRRIDPGSILRDQNKRPNKSTTVGMQTTDARICAPSHSVPNLY